jgi:ABC-type phosphate transport system permease subunit
MEHDEKQKFQKRKKRNYKAKKETKINSLIFKTIYIYIILIIIISISLLITYHKIFRRNNKEYKKETKIFTLDEKRFLNNTLNENLFFLQYKQKVEKKDEQFEENAFITVDLVKKK